MLAGGHKGIRLLGCRMYLLGFGGTLQVIRQPANIWLAGKQGVKQKYKAARRVCSPCRFYLSHLVENSLPNYCALNLFTAVLQ